MSRMGTGIETPAVTSKSPTASATRYVGRGGVVANRKRKPSSVLLREDSGMFEKAVIPGGTFTAMSNGVLSPGSSKQGNIRRAHVGSNWVNAYQRSRYSTRNSPRESFKKENPL